MNLYLTLTPRDPLVVRDGRPFGPGQYRMRVLPWFYPSVVAGSFRTLLGKEVGGFDPNTVKALKGCAVGGPFPFVNGKVYLPSPADAVAQEETQGGEKRFRFHAVYPSPFRDGEGWDLKEPLKPLLIPSEIGDFKAVNGPAWWSVGDMVTWLTLRDGQLSVPAGSDRFPFLIPVHERWHVAIDPETRSAREEMLFMSSGLDLNWKGGEPIRIVVKVTLPDGLARYSENLDVLHPLGGERRLVHWTVGGDNLWRCPEEVKKALGGTKHVRMVLATPGLFKGGWRPGWLERVNEGWCGSPPGTRVRLKLVSAAVGRWLPHSGWSLEKGQRGPKPVWRLAPAGSTYFFEVVEGDPSTLTGMWFAPVSDKEQDRNDGFGLALWGVWDRFDRCR